MVEAADLADSMLSGAGLSPAFDDLIISTPETLILIPSGEYDAICTYCRKEKRFNRDLLAFKFKIASFGPHLNTVIPGYINLAFCRGKSRTAPPRSKLAKWLRTIALYDPTISTKRFKLSTFGEFQFTVMVEASDTDHNQEPCEPTSRVTEILDVVGRLGRPNR